jgi:hypothetical protein
MASTVEAVADAVTLEIQDVSGAPKSRRGSLSPEQQEIAALQNELLRVSSQLSATAGPEKLSFKTVDAMVKKIYTDADMTQSTALDILATYIKGQKILYTEAKTLCEQRLHTLMLPAILVTALCTVLSLFLKDYSYGGIVVASLNGFNSFLLALISYLKLDAKAEAHKTSAYKYDKLQAFCEFKSGSILFVDDPANNVATIIKEIETNVKEIKETNQFVLPESVRFSYEKLYTTNIFSHVKAIQNEEMMLTNKLKGVINTLVTLNTTGADSDEILAKEGEQNAFIEQIMAKRSKYMQIDDIFNQEIKEQTRKGKARWGCMGWLKT